MKNNSVLLKGFLILILMISIVFSGCTKTDVPPADKTQENNNLEVQKQEDSQKQEISYEKTVSSVNDKDYTLDKVVVLSRHNVRAPLSTKGSDLYRMTPHKWIDWTSEPSELSVHGGNLETIMGQYFRKYLAQKQLLLENEIYDENQVRIYSNSLQRTIATARFFAAGLLPVSETDVEYHEEVGKMDPVFNPKLTIDSEAFKSQVMSELEKMGGDSGLQGIEEKLAPNYKILEEALDLKDSEIAKQDKYDKFPTDDLEISLVLDKEPSLKGSLKKATTAADALILQYYEDEALDAPFGKNLSLEDWKKIGEIKDVYGEVLFAAPSVAVNVANPLIKEVKSEFENNQRKFTFLCGHDSNLASFLAALEVEDYQLPNAVELKTPIGAKLVMEQWRDSNNKLFVSFKLVYYSIDQFRNLTEINLENPPEVFDVSFKGMQKNKDGMYKYEDVIERFNKALEANEKLPR